METQTTTQNSAKAVPSSLSKTLDFFARGAALRKMPAKDVTNLFLAAYQENPNIALKLLFYIRDIRGGQGERETFRVIFKYLAENMPEFVRHLLPLIPQFGRWDDLMVFVDTPLEAIAFDIFSCQLNKDLEDAVKENTTISIAAKWAPSENCSEKVRIDQAHKFRLFRGEDSKTYRQNLSVLRKKIDILEQKLCVKDYTFDYSKIPSCAGVVYRKAFSRNDAAKYTAFLASVKKGEVKINTGTLYPYDLIAPFFNSMVFSAGMTKVGDKYYVSTQKLAQSEEESLDTYWNNLPNYLEDKKDNSIVVVDTSGSMRGQPIKVAISLGIYIAERNGGRFYNQFITFSETPIIQDIEGSTIGEKVRNLASTEWGTNTNISAVFQTLLDAAKKFSIPKEEMPSRIIIVSDMQFDIAGKDNSSTNYEHITLMYQEFGYQMPELVFWNVNAVANNSPATKNDNVRLISGCSPSILKNLLSGKSSTPTDLMLEVLGAERYSQVVSLE